MLLCDTKKNENEDPAGEFDAVMRSSLSRPAKERVFLKEVIRCR
jgi:hypothetical protein